MKMNNKSFLWSGNTKTQYFYLSLLHAALEYIFLSEYFQPQGTLLHPQFAVVVLKDVQILSSLIYCLTGQ